MGYTKALEIALKDKEQLERTEESKIFEKVKKEFYEQKAKEKEQKAKEEVCSLYHPPH